MKVDREEWMRASSKDWSERELQRAVARMFMLTLEWFGLPDGRKRHNE